jgi:hypothetical protein
MATTHAAMGSLLALPLAVVAPELAPAAALGALAGGYFPDADILGPLEHRKTLHFPEYYPPIAAALSALAYLRPSPLAVAVAFGALSAALHSLTDALGGGLGLRPWEEDDERGVYSHLGGRWIPPRRWIRYDGAPEDLLAVFVLSAPGLAAFDGPVRMALLGGIVVSACYTAFRKRLPEIGERFV